MTQQFKAMKIRIKDAIHSRMVQEALFEMGYKWVGFRDTTVRNTDGEVLWTDGGSISWSGMEDFNICDYEEVELVTTYAFKPVDQEAKRKREEKEALEKNIAEMQKQLDEMKQKLENM